MRAAAAVVGVAAAGLLLAGCSGGLHSDVPSAQVYMLRAAGHPLAVMGQSGAVGSVRVGRPAAAPGLDTDHIVTVQSDHRMSFYSGSRWPASLPAVVESLAVDALRGSVVWSNVQDSASSFASDYVLQIVIRRFEADYSVNPATPEIHVILDCTLGSRASREVIASFLASGTAMAAANRLGDVVSAFEDASNQALGEVAARSAEAVRAASQHQNVDRPVPSITR